MKCKVIPTRPVVVPESSFAIRSTKEIELSVGSIHRCIFCGAKVYAIKKDGSLVLLNGTDYKKVCKEIEEEEAKKVEKPVKKIVKHAPNVTVGLVDNTTIENETKPAEEYDVTVTTETEETVKEEPKADIDTTVKEPTPETVAVAVVSVDEEGLPDVEIDISSKSVEVVDNSFIAELKKEDETEEVSTEETEENEEEESTETEEETQTTFSTKNYKSRKNKNRRK